MEQHRLRAVFMRGGTSKAVMFRRSDLPADEARWAPIFTSLMGSPDANGRQLDGMGGGVSSLSKVCVIGPPTRPDADIDYTFAQIVIGEAVVDYSANCGNMSSAVGPFAVDEGLVPRPAGPEAVVRIHNTNTKKIIVSRFPMDGAYAAVDGSLAIDGVSGTGAPVRLDFTDPGGAKTGKLLPTGKAMDVLDVPGVGAVEASMIDAANPCVFLGAERFGASATERPDALERDAALLEKLEAIRRQASIAMGIARDWDQAGKTMGVPKVAIVAPPTETKTLSGRVLAPGEVDILVRLISVGQPHRAVPLTGALCLAVACRVPGSVPNRLMTAGPGADIRVGHPSGITVVAAEVAVANGAVSVPYASVYRTARRLFQGEVLFRASPTA
jgi:2-methylaconitate cis-trans-isomerase PrpF